MNLLLTNHELCCITFVQVISCAIGIKNQPIFSNKSSHILKWSPYVLIKCNRYRFVKNGARFPNGPATFIAAVRTPLYQAWETVNWRSFCNVKMSTRACPASTVKFVLGCIATPVMLEINETHGWSRSQNLFSTACSSLVLESTLQLCHKSQMQSFSSLTFAFQLTVEMVYFPRNVC